MKLGYARVSTGEQNLRLQIQALKAAGCDRIFEDKGVSGSAVLKPAYGDLLRHARAGDEVIIWKMDRLSRSLGTLITELQMLASLDLGFRSLTEQIETVTPTGKLFFHVVGAFAQFERDVIRERTMAGLTAARRAGVRLGRPPMISTEQLAEARVLIAEPHNRPVAKVAELLGVSRQALYKRLKTDDAVAEQGEPGSRNESPLPFPVVE
jgi:DNA invertase Pin-like site-specific DNA recombinase